jgi:5-methylcytosine-specific restriction endonuclease McrA
MVQVDKDKFTVDHVVPRSRGGKTTWQNSVVACMPCNTKKRDMSPDEAGLKLNKKPRQPLGLTCKSYFLYNPSMPKEWEAWLISK